MQPLFDNEYVQCAVVGIVREKKPDVFGYKRAGAEVAGMPDGRTMFEIGSLTKLFTLFLLADLVRDGTIDFDSQVSAFLPEIHGLSDGQKAAMTVRHLVAHKSGLPRDIENKSTDYRKQFEDFRVQDLYDYLDGCELKSAPGAEVLYSNVGYGLLGHILGRASNTAYKDLLNARILDPLGMKDTFLLAKPEQHAVQGHDADGNAAPGFGLQPDNPLSAAGGLISNADDMLKFMQAWLHESDSPLGSLFASLEMHLGFGKDGMLRHSGQTYGYHAFLSAGRKRQSGVVVLADTGTIYVTLAGGAIADLLAQGNCDPVKFPQSLQGSVPVEQSWVGDYEIPANLVYEPGVIQEIRQANSGLIISTRTRGAASPPAKLYPVSPGRFFIKSLDIEFEFEDGNLVMIPGQIAKHIFGGESFCCRKVHAVAESTPISE